jgi:ABC-type branched-subunit amino acid transport system ATPase component
VFIFYQAMALPLITGGIAKLSGRLVTLLRFPHQGGPTRLEPQRSRPPMTLQLDGITVKFGGVTALDNVSFEVKPGEIVGLIGPNGAGKTTLLDVATGFTRPTTGSMTLDGAPIDGWTAVKRARQGLVRSWQGVELFEAMTIRENLLVAADRNQGRNYFIDLVRPGRPRPSEVMEQMIEQFGLQEYLERRPSALSQGLTRLVGIARAVVAEPRLLLLDEPAAGLDQAESAELAEVIRSIANRYGIGILVVEHDVPLLMNLCDRLVVLDFGKLIASGTPDEIQRNPLVIEAYLGGTALEDAIDSGLTVAP